MTPAPDSLRRQFASDNRSGICPEAWDALARANAGHAGSYGGDPWTPHAEKLIHELFETDCEVFFTATGTAANSLAIAALCASYHSVICHEASHVETDECNAPGYFAHGVKLSAVGGANGKMSLAEVELVATQRRDVHSSKPRVLSLTQATELGTVYVPGELETLSAAARRLGLVVHMDGARFANAAAASGKTPAQLSWKSGVDVLCLGGTKNGMSCGEAVIFFDKNRGGELSREFAYRRKQAGQLVSKMRFISAQWVGMLEGGMKGAWLRHGTHSNAMTRKLEAAIRATGLEVMYPVEANAVFVRMEPARQEKLQAKGWAFYTFMQEDCVRFMCSWDTKEEDIAALVADLRAT